MVLDLGGKGRRRPAARVTGQPKLGDVGVDGELAVVQRGGDPVVAVEDPVLAAEAEDVDRGQDREAIRRGAETLPAGPPVVRSKRLEREEVAAPLPSASHRRAGDVGHVDRLKTELPGRCISRFRVLFVEHRQRVLGSPADSPNAGARALVQSALRRIDDRVRDGADRIHRPMDGVVDRGNDATDGVLRLAIDIWLVGHRLIFARGRGSRRP